MRVLAAIPTIFLACATAGSGAAEPPAQPSSAAADSGDLYDIGRQLFNQYAPPAVKEQYEFPSRDQWDAFATKLQSALQGDSVPELAQYAPQARAALTALRTVGGDDALADWLEQRLDEIEAAQQAQGPAGNAVNESQPSAPPSSGTPPAQSPPNAPSSAASSPAPAPAPLPAPRPSTSPRIPYYELWLQRVESRPVPARAGELMPTLRSAFAAEGVPPALAWIAEAESSLNPNARSPAGAKGLFQLMPDTAHQLGLDTFLPDERTDPGKSARAAARYLRELHDRFGTWPLTLAAYNAGEGRVSRALAAHKAKDFATIASSLPAETRMYVPKVCALVAVRSGRPLAGL